MHGEIYATKTPNECGLDLTAFDQNWAARDTIEDSLSQAEDAASVACWSLIASTLEPSMTVLMP